MKSREPKTKTKSNSRLRFISRLNKKTRKNSIIILINFPARMVIPTIGVVNLGIKVLRGHEGIPAFVFGGVSHAAAYRHFRVVRMGTVG
jgi:hypothetical protein